MGSGDGVPKDITRAADWYQKAAEQRDWVGAWGGVVVFMPLLCGSHQH